MLTLTSATTDPAVWIGLFQVYSIVDGWILGVTKGGKHLTIKLGD